MAIISIQLYYKDPQQVNDPCIDGGQGNPVTAWFDDQSGTITNLLQIYTNNVAIYDSNLIANPLASGWYSETPYPDVNSTDIYEWDNLTLNWTNQQTCGAVQNYAVISAWYKDPIQIDPGLPADQTDPCTTFVNATQIDLYYDPAETGGNTSIDLSTAIVNGVNLYLDSGLSQLPYDGWWADANFPSTTANIDIFLYLSTTWQQVNPDGSYTTCVASSSTSGTSGLPGVYSISLTRSGVAEDLCLNTNDPGSLLFSTVWYWSSNGPKTLAEIAAADIPIFVDDIWALNYGNGLNTNLQGAEPTAFYREFNQTGIFFWSYDPADPNSAEWINELATQCPPLPTPQVWSITLYSDPTSSTLPEWCCSLNSAATTYYYFTEVEYLNLKALANDNIFLYKTANAAQNSTASELIPFGIYGATGNNDEILEFKQDINGFPTWFGLSSIGRGVASPNIVNYYDCASYSRPAGSTVVNIQSTRPFANKMFYAFWTCAPTLSSGQFVMYVVDGQHLANRENFMSDFITTMIDNSLTTFNTGIGGLGCLTIKHKIIAETIEEAMDLVRFFNNDYTSSPVQQADISDLGIFNNANVPIYTDCCTCILNTNSSIYSFGDIGISIPVDLGPNFNVERNAKIDNVAKPLLRTNPKLTTNVKLVVNSRDKIYLESIDATDTLASTDYKKFPVNPNSSYAYDLARFYNKNRTPLEIAYSTKRRDSDFSVYSQYEKQIEEDYQYGTTINYSKLHSESFRMFAPIYVDLNMPKKFVIYRIKDPKPVVDISDSSEGNLERIKRLIANSDIVKVFDLTKDSNIGTYLRNYVQDQSFPKAPITFSFEENEKTTFNGVDLVKGGFTQKAEFVYKDFILKDKPMIAANDFITDGFRRNNMAVANIINMEFLFDDPNASEYSVNRYIGLYVDDIETGTGRISSINKGDIMFKSLNSYMDSNLNYAAIPSYKMLNEMPILAYARAGDNYYRIDNSTRYDHSRFELRVIDPLNKIPQQLGIKYKGVSVDIKANSSASFDFMKVKVVDIPSYNDKIALINVKRESYRFTFIKFVANTNIQIDDTNGNSITFNTGIDVNTAITNLEAVFTAPFADVYDLETNIIDGKITFILTEKSANILNLAPEVTTSGLCIINRTEIYTNVEVTDKSYYAADSNPAGVNYLPKGTFKGQYFSTAGSTVDVAIALTKLIRNVGEFDAFNIGSDIYISIKIPGYKLLQHALLYYKNNNVRFLDFENINVDVNNELNLSAIATSTWQPYFFKGGNLTNKSILINKETSGVLNAGEYIETSYLDRYNQVVDIVENIDDITGNYLKVILKSENSIADGEVRVFTERDLVMGLLSAYTIYDMDFDFHDISNSNLKDLKFETADQIIYEPYKNSTDWLTSDYALEPAKYFANLQPILTNEVVDDIDNDIITSEYDRLNENKIKEFAIGSRIVPNINKWVLKDGITVRDEPYHLNAYSAFGRTNFAPDLEITSRDRKAFTHEWFYIENLPDYLRFWQINETFSYVNFIKGFDLNKTLFKSVDKDYFDMFMVGEGHEVEYYDEDPLSRDLSLFNANSYIKSNLHKKYTLIDGGSSENFANTIFKGLNVVFKKRNEFVNNVASEFVKTTDFNGYKFSAVLKINNQAANNSIEYEVIQNKKFKFVIFYITLNTGDIWASDVNRKLLYELKHQLVYNSQSTPPGYEYADIITTGALDLKSVNFNNIGPYKVLGISDINGNLPKFKSQITKYSDGTYNKLRLDLGTLGIYEVQVLSVESDNEIIIQGKPTHINTGSPLDTVGLNIVDLRSAVYTYMGGGIGIQEVILNELTAGNVAAILSKNDDRVLYTTVEEDGTINYNRFTINFLDGKEFIKKVDLGVVEDIDKPSNYKLSGVSRKLIDVNGTSTYVNGYSNSKNTIGYRIVPVGEHYEFMVRHSGNYTIDLEPIVTFTDIYTHFKTNRNHLTSNPFEMNFEIPLYKHSLTSVSEVNIAESYYNKFNRCGVAFNLGFIKDSDTMGLIQNKAIVPQAGSHDLIWGKIKNHYYHKVNEINPDGVLNLTKSTEFLPLYPMIGEIAIDYKDVNVFKSSWENGYYTRSLAGGKSVEVPGTFDTAEERSYLGSTVMKLEDSYFLTEFTVQQVDVEEELDDILRTHNNTGDVVFYENNQILIADFYLDQVVYKKLSSLGALNTLIQFIDPLNSIGDKTTLTDDMQEYVDKNLIRVFIVDEIDIWVNRFKGSSSNILSTPNIDLLDNNAFIKDTSFTYRQHGDRPLNFRLIYNKRLGYSYNIRPMIKIQS